MIFCVSCSRFTPHSFDRPVVALPYEREIRMNNLNGILRSEGLPFLSVLDPFHRDILRRTRHGKKERERDKCLEWPISRVLSFNASSDPAAETSEHKKKRQGGEVGIKKSSARGLRLTGPSGIRQPRYDFVRLPISMHRRLEKLRTCSACEEKSNPHSFRVLHLAILYFSAVCSL